MFPKSKTKICVVVVVVVVAPAALVVVLICISANISKTKQCTISALFWLVLGTNMSGFGINKIYVWILITLSSQVGNCCQDIYIRRNDLLHMI